MKTFNTRIEKNYFLKLYRLFNIVEINSKKSILILGGNGLVGSSCFRILSESNRYNVNKSTRKDTDLFDFSINFKIN